MFQNFERLKIQTGEVAINVLRGGTGPALLLLHGYPQTHVMWHKVAPRLAEHFSVVVTDLRGYGDSDKPFGTPDHFTYSKRAMARDQVEVMQALGHSRFMVGGHDRGARVAHRMALDHPARVAKLAVLDIVPTHHVFTHVDQTLATGYFHWFFLIQKHDFPERLIGADPNYYLRSLLGRWGADAAVFNPEAIDEYLRCLRDPATIHATCEDYRAAASIDLEHDGADLQTRLQQPLLVLWGEHGFVGKNYDVPNVWRERAQDVRGHALACGHFLPEEQPEETLRALREFFG